MPTVRRTRPRTIKPPLGTALARGNAYAGDGLQQFYAVNEYSGSTLSDAQSGLVLALNASTPWTAATMPGLSCAANGAGAAAIIPAQGQAGLPATIVVAGRCLGASVTAQAPIFGIFGTSTTNVRQFSLEVSNTTPSLNAFGANTSSGAFTAGQDFIFGASVASGNQRTFLNGNLLIATANTGSLTWSATSTVAIGCAQTFFNARNPNMIIYWAGWWQAFQSDNWHAITGWNVNSIWQILQPARGNWLFPSIPAVASLPLFTGSRGRSTMIPISQQVSGPLQSQLFG